MQGTDPPRFVGFIRDITVRRNAEEALRRSEAQLTIAQEIANLGNYVVHFDGKFEDYWSPHLYRVLGRRYGEPYIGVYEYLEPMVHPADRARWQQARDELDAGARSMDIEYRIIHPDGSLRYVHHIAQTTRAAGRPACCGRSARCTTSPIAAAPKTKRARCRIASRTSAASRPWARWRRASRTK